MNNNANAVTEIPAHSLIKSVRLLSKEECGMDAAARRSSPDLAPQMAVASPVSSESIFISAESANQGRRYSMFDGKYLRLTGITPRYKETLVVEYLGWVDLGSSLGWWAPIIATY